LSDNIGSTRDLFNSDAASVKSIVYEMINTGNADIAQQVLEQYALINPADPEINKIRSILNLKKLKPIEENNTSDEHCVLKEVETIFVINRIILGRIGIQDSVLRKVKMMEDVWNYRPLILTCYHNIDQRQAHIWLQTSGDGKVTMSINTRILNVYDYFQNAYAEGLKSKAVYEKTDDVSQYTEIENSVFDVYEGGTLVRQEHFTGYVRSLRMVRNYEKGKKISDFIYDDLGYLNCVREYDSKDENVYQVKYYTTDGFLCMEAFYNHMDEEKDEPERLIVYDEQGCIIKECADRSELAALCLEQIMLQDKFSIIVIEDGLLSKIATSIDTSKSGRAICEVVHNVFLKDPYNLNSEPQRFYRNLCDNHSLFDGVILLTEKAKNDFQDIYGEKKSIFVIPHSYPYEVDKAVFNDRNHKKAVIIARLDPIKQLEHAIYIFSLVVKDVPDARLEIYGRGEEEDMLYEQIQNLGLENNVFLMGFTDDPVSAIKTASLFMMTSLAEGYPLTLVESICNGCPVFSFDIKYGPSEIVDEGKTGFLFHRFDRERFASKIIAFLKDIDLQRDMSENCYTDAQRFNSVHFLDKWYTMTAALYNRRQQ